MLLFREMEMLEILEIELGSLSSGLANLRHVLAKAEYRGGDAPDAIDGSNDTREDEDERD